MSTNHAGSGAARAPEAAYDVVGDSPQTRRIRERIAQVAPTGSTVLITGGLGVGKELMARAIHGASRRAAAPFVVVSGRTNPEAFFDQPSPGLGARHGGGSAAAWPGRGADAGPGTLYLADVAEADPATQLAWLRFLKERRFRRLRGGADGKAAVRIVAATTRNLVRLVENGGFRPDLFYCLNVFSIDVPPLAARRLDIVPLARHFVARFAREAGRELRGFSPAAEGALEAHAWPGNVSELENVVERAVVLEESDRVEVGSLELGGARAPKPRAGPPPGGQPAAGGPEEAPADRLPDSGFVLERHVRDLEREYLARALRQAGGVKVRAAGLLGMTFRSFRYYAKKYDLG